MKIRFIIPGDINTPTGGYRYDRSIIAEWEKAGIGVDVVSLPGNYPFPDEEARNKAQDIINKVASADITIVDGLAGGVLPDELERLSKIGPVVALVHHPLCLETGLSAQEKDELFASEQLGLGHVTQIVTTSDRTSQSVLELFDIKADKITTIEPGVAEPTRSKPYDGGPVRLLSIGSISERKGHDVLIKALARLTDENWSLDIVGPTHFNAELFQKLQNMVEAVGLSEKVRFRGAVDEDKLEEIYANAHIFALASRYEGYGMVYAEAIMAGLPVIGTLAGAIPETVPEGCGLLVPPDDVEALSKALHHLITDDNARSEIRNTCLTSRDHFPTWKKSADAFLEILRRSL